MNHKECPIDIEQIKEGLLLPVRAQPSGKKNAITGVHNRCLKVSVTQIPEKGKANDAFVKVLAKLLKLKKSQISLYRGNTSQQKKFLITGIALEELQMRLPEF
ncbi:hypothetical protein MNBD_PLANCTO02-3420 [hydrothermal vent metagenome]|uniref:COG1872 n=1 Tax=hydrothermal vent metagenome TaxID=652676 RepID=A0A3B1D9K8_9ZZZZ